MSKLKNVKIQECQNSKFEFQMPMKTLKGVCGPSEGSANGDRQWRI